MEKKHFSIIELSLKHRQVITALSLMLCLLGAYALRYMPRQEFPEFKVRQGLVVAAYPGASSNQVDQQVAKPIQDYLYRFKEVRRDKTYSVSKENQTVVYVEVKENVKDPEIFWAKLRLGLQELKTELPPQVITLVGNNEFGDASAILLTITSGQRSYRELEDYLEKLSNAVRRHPAVSNVKRFGLQKEKISVYADPARLAHYGVKPEMLAEALKAEGFVWYGGSVKGKALEMPVHLPARYNSEADIAGQIIYVSPKGNAVRVRDVAKVKREYSVDDSFIECDGQRALALSMEMRFGNNIVDFGKDIDKIIADFRASNPPDLQIKKVADMPLVVSSSIYHFFRDFGMAIVSVILVVMLLLPRRIAVVAAVTIPICILESIGILQGLGVELNTVSLAALVVVLGMVVDNAIVVIDNYIEKLDRGVDAWTAAFTSAGELLVPVFTATLAIIAVFVPEPFFLTGMSRDFVGPMPVTVAVTLFISMLVAMLLVPALCYTFIKTGLHGTVKKEGKRSALDRLQAFYDKQLASAMRKPKRTVAVGIAAIIAGALCLGLVGQQFMPMLERNQFAVEIYYPEGTSLAKNAEVTRKVAELMRVDSRVKDIISFVGTSSPRFHTLYAPQMPAKNYSQLIVITDTNKSTEEAVKEFDEKYRNAFPECHVRVKQLGFLSAEAPIEVMISGESEDEIKAFAQQVKRIMSSEKDITWLRDDYRDSLISVDMDVNREMADRLGVSRQALGTATALNPDGISVASVWEGDYQKDIVLKYETEKTSSAYALGNQYVGSRLSGGAVPLRQIALLRPGYSDGQVVRRNGRLTITVRADIAYGKLAAPVFERVSKKIESLPRPSSLKIDYGGEYSESVESYVPMGKSLLASVFIIFIILLFQFQSVRLSVLVMMTIPLSLIGAMIGLMLVGYPFGMTAFLGVIALFGTVVRNGVILISYARELESGGMSLKEAAFAAGKRRLRPIFLTAAAAAVGVIPLITSGSLLWGPMGTVICFGLIGSTALTLYVLPVAYWKFSGDERETASGKGEKV